MGRGVAISLRIVRVLAVLGILFGIGAAGNSFESSTNQRGIDTGVFGGGVLALLGLRAPEDGDTFPVWIGRFCVVAGIALVALITLALRRARSLGYSDGLPPLPNVGPSSFEHDHIDGRAAPTNPPRSPPDDDDLPDRPVV